MASESQWQLLMDYARLLTEAARVKSEYRNIFLLYKGECTLHFSILYIQI
jgi:hypothetical protein